MISLVSLAVLFGLVSAFFHSSPHQHPGGYFSLGGALLGVAASSVGIRAFVRCPVRRWVAKILTLVFLMGVLWIGVVTALSYLFHGFGDDFGWESICPVEWWLFAGLLYIYAFLVWVAGEFALALWRVLTKLRLMKHRRA
ncbi:MAG: hypothetical protein ABSG04_05015 [Verrucomicrobiota bacterium]